MFIVQVRCWSRGDKELASICARPSIRHRELSRLSVLHSEILISKFRSIDGLSACSIASGIVTTYQQEQREG